MTRRIVLIPGDGIGPEIIEAAQQVCIKATVKGGFPIDFETCYAGGAAIDREGQPLPEATLTACSHADAVLLGAVGGPAWDAVDPQLRPEKAILGLRKALGLYANLRPIRVYPSLAGHSPLKPEVVAGVDMLIVRELNGGIYYGQRSEASIINGVEQAWDTEAYNATEIGRIVSMACKVASQRRRKVTSVDKANVLATSRLWRKTAEETVKDFTDISLTHLYVDNCAMQLVLAPHQFDVVVTSNLFGDILSDEAAVLTGSIGMLPSASIGDGPGLYEPIHGSAPDIAGKGIANPLGTILSAAMLFRYSLGAAAIADAIETAVGSVLDEGYRTADLYKPGLTQVSTEAMGRLVMEHL
ncbi:3-isopropylmalate dehydrogenase [Anaerospora hongkongensis]|uniref:3-isopropylmalate dehydrogenase n=1 Tax=Anaerospora hongkongensis TaxID=244830 RepID=A0A4R1PLW5_9FIRM|nr:3-isopropylmalate dehydrogenase [Anaerospora hongkongensis]TCL31584.1 3-isopropylmalate dehydrogenase [Anaerospora hongkongensis]